MKYFAILACLLLTTACTVVPYNELNLDTTSNTTKPDAGMAGIYAYQWKSGILGAHFDARFKIKDHPIMKINTGEYGYMQLPAGTYEYRAVSGLLPRYREVELEAGQNYFFRSSNSTFSTTTFLISDQDEIDSAKEKIRTGHYELNTID